MKLLITAAGTGNAYAYSLAKSKNFTNIKLFTGDINPANLVTSTIFSDKQYQTLGYTHTDFIENITDIIKENNIDYYLPLIDGEIIKVSYDDFLSKKLVSNSIVFNNFCITKQKYQTLDTDLISFPAILNENNLPNKVIVKKNSSFGSRFTKLLTNKEQVKSLVTEGWNIYEYIDGEEFTIDCFPLNGKAIISIRKRIEVKNGVCTKAKVIASDDYLQKFSDFLIKKFNLFHPFCYQTIKKENKHYLIDLNPRLGAGTAMSSMNGMDFFSAHLALLCKANPIEYLKPMNKSCIVTRQYVEYLMAVEN